MSTNSGGFMSKRILVVTGDGGEGYEALYACHRFLEAGHTPVVAAPSKRRLHLVMHDFEPGWDTYIERPGYGLDADASIDEVSEGNFDAILLLGGRAPEYLRHNRKLVEMVRLFHDSGKWVFAICHGIQILVAAGLAKERCVTCYEHVRGEVELAGGFWSGQQAVRDGRIVTAQTWQSHPEFYREIFHCLGE
jgi:protease I